MNTLGRKKTIDFAWNIARLVFRLLVLVRAVQELPVTSPRQQMGKGFLSVQGEMTHLMKSASSELDALMGGVAVALGLLPLRP